MLNINSLNNKRDLKQINRFSIYNKVLKKCHHRIKIISNKGESFCFYIVPEFIYGVPKYNILNCANYIVNKLRKNGFNVMYTYPNLIWISWEHIPSEFKNNIKSKDKKSIHSHKSNKSSYRNIDDYQISKNFLNKINLN